MRHTIASMSAIDSTDATPPRERWRPNVTVAAIARRVRDGRTEYLLVEEHTPQGLRLNNPAGHLDPGESLVDAVCRETLEETACVLTPLHLVGIYLARLGDPPLDETYLRFAFAGAVGEPDPSRTLDTPIVRTLWLTLDDARASRDRHRSPLVMRCLDDDARGRAFPLEAIAPA